MKRKNEENLIKLAFGDIDPREAEHAKQLLASDHEASKLFAGYEEIREGLKQLHTPEHQLSTERLREAILRDGLKKEKPSASGWRWTLAPVAVAAAAMLITLRFGGHSNPGVFPAPAISNSAREVKLSGHPDLNPSSTKNPIVFQATSKPSGDMEWIDVPPATNEVARTIQVDPSKLADAKALTATFRSVKSTRDESKPKVSPEDVSHMAIEGALPAGAVAMNFDAGGEQPIVLIGSESDESTGANRATEVNSTSNVVIGG
jgi:hypothetical protein